VIRAAEEGRALMMIWLGKTALDKPAVAVFSLIAESLFMTMKLWTSFTTGLLRRTR
jgi:hypothetical protein